MEWLADLESTCAALGSSDGVNYYKDEECIECVKVCLVAIMQSTIRLDKGKQYFLKITFKKIYCDD